MSITQISRIQCRKGKHEDLPQLAGGELGWAIDTRKLFIGNGRQDEGAPELGNTEILTEYTSIEGLNIPGITDYTYSGEVAGVNAPVQTNLSVDNPVKRRNSEKLDDFANLRDFAGELGSGITLVDLINHAISELYKSAMTYPSTHAHRTLIIPAGRYEITGDVIKLLPYVKLRGEGKNVTTIVQTDSTQPCVAKSYDSTGTQDGVTIGTNNAIMPGMIELEKITLINATNNHTLVIDSAVDILIKESSLRGSQSVMPTTVIGNESCVHIKSSVGDAARITFNDCEFADSMYAILSDSSSTNVIVDGALIGNLFSGIRLGSTLPGVSQPSAWKITNSYFLDIVAEGIWTQTKTGGINSSDTITSSNNTFNNVGDVALTHVVDLGGDNSYSIGDTFITRDKNSTVQAIKLRGDNSFAFMPGSKTQFGNQITESRNIVTMNDDQPAATESLGVVGVVEDYLAPTIIDYVITRGQNKRLGTMKISAIDSASLVYIDDYVEAGQVNVNLVPTMNAINTNVELRYTSEPASIAATLTTTSRTLI